jgi:hypothetical protein
MLSACGSRPFEVDAPFYLWHLEDEEAALFRCPHGPDRGCAIDGLPGPTVLAAGADKRFVVVRSTNGYFYFARVPSEKSGWGNSPEKIIGPLTENEFVATNAKLSLPPLTVIS